MNGTRDEARERAPIGYGYRYPDGIRFDTGGRPINGSQPLESFPLYTKEDLVAERAAGERAGMERAAQWIKRYCEVDTGSGIFGSAGNYTDDELIRALAEEGGGE